MNNSDIYSISNLAIKDAWYDTDKNIVLYVRDIIKSFLEKYEYIKIKVKDKLQFCDLLKEE